MYSYSRYQPTHFVSQVTQLLVPYVHFLCACAGIPGLSFRSARMADTVRGLREMACMCSICSSTVPGAAKRTTSTVAVWPMRCKRPMACCSKEGVGATSRRMAVWATVSVRPAAPPHVRSGTSRTAGGAHVLKLESASCASAPAPNNFSTWQKPNYGRIHDVLVLEMSNDVLMDH